MLEKKVFIYSTDRAIAIIESIFNLDEYTVKILSKKSYLKSRFFEAHRKILQQIFTVSNGISSIDLKTNLMAESEIYKLFSEYDSHVKNYTIQANYRTKEEDLKRTYSLLIDSNLKDVSYQDKITEKRIMSELTQKSFDDISDYSFLVFIDSLPKKIEVHKLSYIEQWRSKKAAERNSTEPLFGGALTNRGLKDIFL